MPLEPSQHQPIFMYHSLYNEQEEKRNTKDPENQAGWMTASTEQAKRTPAKTKYRATISQSSMIPAANPDIS